NRVYIYIAGVLPNLAVYAFYGRTRDSNFDAFFVTSLVTLALTAIASLLLDLRVLRKDGVNISIKPFHRIAARLALSILWLYLGLRLLTLMILGVLESSLTLIALFSTIVLLVACLWDEESDFAPRWLWSAGLLLIGEVFLAVKPQGRGLIAGIVIVLSLY